MQSSSSSSRGSLQRHTSTVFSLGFLMGLLDGSSPGFTATRLITPKSLEVSPYFGWLLTFKQDLARKYQEPGPVSLPTLHGKAD